MPTTTNFGWTTPADTDYVKDGALAIRTLANGIDTSLVDLKGGTTGQYLIKNSNTDLDFTWTTNTADIDGITATSPLTGGGTSGTITVGIQDGTTTQKGAVQLEDSTSSTSTTKAATPNSVKSAYDLANGAIAKSLVDAAGDLIYATADNTVARLALGTAGQVLTVNSGATAPEWKTAASGGKVLQVVQSTTSSAVSVASTTFTDTGLSASITPSSASSKVLILVAQKYYHYRENLPLNARLQIIRGATAILEFQNNSSRLTATLSGGYADLGAIWSPVYLDSPSTTSSVTYKTQARTEDTTNAHQINFQGNSGTAVMILLEIGA